MLIVVTASLIILIKDEKSDYIQSNWYYQCMYTYTLNTLKWHKWKEVQFLFFAKVQNEI